MAKESSVENFSVASVHDEGIRSLGADMFTPSNASVWRTMGRDPAADAAIFQIRQQSFEGHVAQEFEHASGVAFTSAAENAKSGEQPDFFLGEDGQLRPNPAKTEPPKDGKLNIQIEGPADASGNSSEVEAARIANENQKASIREMIAYFQKFNPGAEIPRHWLDQLERQPDLPSGGGSKPAKQESGWQQDTGRQQDAGWQQNAAQGGGPGGPPLRGGGGGYGGGGGGGGYRGGGERAFDPSERVVSRGGDRPHNPPPVPGDMNVAGPPTITPEKIDQILHQYHSPAANEPGIGQYIYDAGVKAGINPAVALAFFIQESSAGTAGLATHTNSWGNIKGEGPAGSYHGHRAYHNYKEGVDDWYRLIKDKYLAGPERGGFGAETLSQIISHYAPSSDGNNEREYVANVKGMVTGWANQTKNA